MHADGSVKAVSSMDFSSDLTSLFFSCSGVLSVHAHSMSGTRNWSDVAPFPPQRGDEGRGATGQRDVAKVVSRDLHLSVPRHMPDAKLAIAPVHQVGRYRSHACLYDRRLARALHVSSSSRDRDAVGGGGLQSGTGEVIVNKKMERSAVCREWRTQCVEHGTEGRSPHLRLIL